MLHVVWTVYRRPSYLCNALRSWENARGIERTKHTFMLEPSDRRNLQVDLIESSSLPYKTIHFNPERYGVLRNPWEGLDRAFSNVVNPDDPLGSFVFVAEEDVVVSDDIVEYLEFASQAFYTRRCLGVCANTHRPDEQDPAMLCRSASFDPLGWGTWIDRWNHIFRNTWDKDYSTGNNGVNAGWDHNINLRLIPQHADNHFLFPAGVSRTDHVGKFEGAHMIPEFFGQSQSPTFREHIEPQDYFIYAEGQSA